MKKAIFLDRDGTIIVDKIYLNDVNAIEYYPESFEALKILRDAGYVFIIVTNQSGLARGLVQTENLNLIHQKIRADFTRYGVDLAGFYWAPYSAHLPHPRRKPEAGLIREAAYDHGIDLKKSWMIGDRMTDVEAGHRAGTRTVLIGVTEEPIHPTFAPPEFHLPSLFEAATVISSLNESI
jgi:D-glycero-D-manno-heptose 1,7-bisphosphate phosphatase